MPDDSDETGPGRLTVGPAHGARLLSRMADSGGSAPGLLQECRCGWSPAPILKQRTALTETVLATGTADRRRPAIVKGNAPAVRRSGLQPGSGPAEYTPAIQRAEPRPERNPVRRITTSTLLVRQQGAPRQVSPAPSAGPRETHTVGTTDHRQFPSRADSAAAMG